MPDSEWFKKVYVGKSLGDFVQIEGAGPSVPGDAERDWPAIAAPEGQKATEYGPACTTCDELVEDCSCAPEGGESEAVTLLRKVFNTAIGALGDCDEWDAVMHEVEAFLSLRSLSRGTKP